MDSRADELMELCAECKKLNKNFFINSAGCKIEICNLCRYIPHISRKHRNYDREEDEVE